MRVNWKDPISAVSSAASQLIGYAEQYWIHVGIGIVLFIFVVMYLIIKKGI